MSAASKRSFLVDAASVFGSRIGVMVLSLLTGVILARVLGPEGKGILTTLMVYPAFVVTLAEFGVRQAIVYEVGRGVHPPSRVIGSAILLFVFSAAIGMVLVAGTLAVLGNQHFSMVLIALAVALIPVQLANKYSAGVLLGLNRVSQFNRVSWLPPLVTLALTALLVWMFPLGTAGALFATVAGSAVVAGYGVFLLSKTLEQRPSADHAIARSMIRQGFGYAAALFVISLNYRIDIVMLERLRPIADVGQYSVGVGIAELVWQIPAAIGVIVFARSARSTDKRQFSLGVTRLFRVALLVSVAAGCVLALAGRLLVTLAYGVEFAPAAEVIALLLPGIIAMIVHKVLNMDLAGRGKPYIALYSFLPALVVNVILNLWFIPRWGPHGAAVASSVSYLVAAALFVFQYSSETGVHVRQIFAFSRDDFQFLPRLVNRLSSKSVQ